MALSLHMTADTTESEPASGKTASRITFVAFHDTIQTNAATITTFTHARHNAKLGILDQLVLQAVAKRAAAVSGVLQLTVDIEHSANGLHWIPKFATPVINTPLNTYGPTYPTLALDDGSTPSLGFVRLSITLSATTGPVTARLKIVATANDYHEHQFAQRAERFQSAHDVSEYYYLCYQSSHVFSPQDFTPTQLILLRSRGYAPFDASKNFRFPIGVTCCFRQDGEFILVKDKSVVFMSAAK